MTNGSSNKGERDIEEIRRSLQGSVFGHGMANITGRSPFAYPDRAHTQFIPCLGWAGRIFGHKFELLVTFDEHERSITLGENARVTADELRNLTTYRTVHSSAIRCVRCGVEVK